MPSRRHRSAKVSFLALPRTHTDYHLTMTSRHNRWQARWQIDSAAGLAVHETGLRVRLLEGRGVAENADEVALALALQHGTHNAPAMVQRLVREGTQLLIDPHSRGWRH